MAKVNDRLTIPYSGKVWWGESLANHPRFAKLKPSKLVLAINNLLADLLIRQTFVHQMFETSQFAKLSCYMVYLELCGSYALLAHRMLHASGPDCMHKQSL